VANFLDHLEAEILALKSSLETDPRFVKLRELRRIKDLYLSDSASAVGSDSPRTRAGSSASQRKSVTRKMSPETERVIEESERLLDGRSSPTPLRDVFHHVVDICGCHIGGKDPINGLSSILSRAGKFKAHGRAGWTLAEPEAEPSQTETPNSETLFGAPKSNGAAPLSP
jgi:hypothetical protein